MISIVIPVYNANKYIYLAIDSCLKQEFQDFEILVINDGSTDALNKKELKEKSPKIRYLYQENSGAGIARNLGLHHSLGEFIVFLDADDMLEEGALFAFSSAIGKYNFIIGKCKRVFIDANEIAYKEEIWKEVLYRSSINKYSMIVDTLSTNKMYRRSFLLSKNIKFEYGAHEDIFFVLKLFESTNNFSFVDRCVYQWNVRDGIDTRSSILSIATLKDRIAVLTQCIMYTHDVKLKKAIIDNAIEHDLKRYIKISSLYSKKDIEILYELYRDFEQKYCQYISISFLELDKEKSIERFLMISKRHLAGKFYIKKIISHGLYTKIHQLNLYRKKYFYGRICEK